MDRKRNEENRYIEHGYFQSVKTIEGKKRPVVSSIAKDFVFIGEAYPSAARAEAALKELMIKLL